MKVKDSKKMDKYLNLARELKRLYNIRELVIPIIVGGLRMVPMDLEKRLEENQRENRDYPLHNVVKID